MEEYQHQLFVRYEGQEERTDLLKTFQKHFSLKRSSGGGDCCISKISSNSFCISFRSEQVRNRVLQQEQKILIANTDVPVTLSLQANVSNTKVDSLPLYEDQKKIDHSEACTEEIEIPTEALYTELLEPLVLKTIQGDTTDVKFYFDPSTRMLEIKGSLQLVSSTKTEVYNLLDRLKSKEIKLEPVLVSYLKSIGSGNISKKFFCKADVYATIDLISNTSVIINGLCTYDINRAIKLLKEDTEIKEVLIPEEAVSVVLSKKFENFVEDLRRKHSIHISMPSLECDNKIILAGQNTDLFGVKKKVKNFIKEQTTVTEYIKLEAGNELTENLPLLLDWLGLSHFSGCIKWNPDCETLEISGTSKTITEIKAAIDKKTKGLKCETVTICQPEAFSYFKEAGQLFLNSLDTMMFCMAVLSTNPGQVNLQAVSLFQTNDTSTDTHHGICFHEGVNEMFFVADNVIVEATALNELPKFADILVNPLCASVSDSKILNAAGAKVKAELGRRVQRSTITLTGPGKLPCRLLIHVPCLCGSRADEYLKDVIQECQKRKFKSIAIFVDINELHSCFNQKSMSIDFIRTAIRHMEAEEKMTIVFAQDRFFQCFKNTAKTFYNELNMMSTKEILFLHVTPFSMTCCLTSSAKRKDLESLHRHSNLCEPAVIHIFSKTPIMLKKAKVAIENHYAAFLSTDMLVHPFLRTCGDQVLPKIRRLREKHGINVIILDGTVLFNGRTVKTSIAKEEAYNVLKEAAASLELEHKENVFRNVKWLLTDAEENIVQLSCEDSYNAELQYMCQQELFDVKHGNETFTVNVAEMTAINKETAEEYEFLRTEIVNEFPGKWDISEDENFQKVKIDQESFEYFQVERQFNETLSDKIINKIERIENKILWKRFSLGISGEVKLLFYSVKHADVEQVEKTGFFRPPETFFFSQNNLGRGIYFHVDASAALRRCDVNTSGQRIMFLGRAETGAFTVGRRGINVPPPVDPSNPGILYHSVVDNKDNPTVFVLFSADRTYPEYCITFTD